MSLKTICDTMARDVGIPVSDQIVSSPKIEWQEAVSFSNLVGEELARRVDFGQLERLATLAGSGPSGGVMVAADFCRLSPGVCVTHNGNPLRPLTKAEWTDLPVSAGDPRYFLLEGSSISFWPPLELGESVSISYQSKNWCNNGSDAWANDTDEAVIDETLMAKGLIVRWRRHKGMDYADHEAEYEATLRDIAGFDDRSRL